MAKVESTNTTSIDYHKLLQKIIDCQNTNINMHTKIGVKAVGERRLTLNTMLNCPDIEKIQTQSIKEEERIQQVLHSKGIIKDLKDKDWQENWLHYEMIKEDAMICNGEHIIYNK